MEKDFAADLPKVKTRGTGLSQVWTNLLDNATDAAPEGRRCGFGRGRRTAGSASGIADQGAGIAPEIRDQIFQPFYTTKPPGVGTGLGLEIARRIVTAQYGGTIGFSSEPGNTEFVVKLPIEGSQ